MPVIVESDSRDSFGSWGIIGRHLRDEDLEEEEEEEEGGGGNQVFDSVLCFCSCIKFTLVQTAIEVSKPTRSTYFYVVAIKDTR